MSSRTSLFVLLLAAAAPGLVGCPAVDSRLTNQGGGTLVSAGLKVAQGRMTELTPDEVQLLTDAAFQTQPGFEDFELSDEEAEAAVDFLVLNDLDNVGDIEALVDQAETDPTSVQIPDTIVTLIDVRIDEGGVASLDPPNQ